MIERNKQLLKAIHLLKGEMSCGYYAHLFDEGKSKMAGYVPGDNGLGFVGNALDDKKMEEFLLNEIINLANERFENVNSNY